MRKSRYCFQCVYSHLIDAVLGILKFNIVGDKTESVVTTQPLIITTSVH
jgi:hypothetical protein